MIPFAMLLIAAVVGLVGVVLSFVIWGAGAVINGLLRALVWLVAGVLRLVVVAAIRLFYALRGVALRLH